MPSHIGIVGGSAEGAALCYRTICVEGAKLLGTHAHPEVTLHTSSPADYNACVDRGDWEGVGELILRSAAKLASVGAAFLICPDNTFHQALPLIEARSPLPWLHIAEVVAREAAGRGFRRVGLLGTRSLVQSEVYPERLAPRGIECVRSNAGHSPRAGVRRLQARGGRVLSARHRADEGRGLRCRGARLHRDPDPHERREFRAADAGFDAVAGAGGAGGGGRREQELPPEVGRPWRRHLYDSPESQGDHK